MTGKLTLCWEDGESREIVLTVFGVPVELREGEKKSLTVRHGEWVIEEESSFTPGEGT